MIIATVFFILEFKKIYSSFQTNKHGIDGIARVINKVDFTYITKYTYTHFIIQSLGHDDFFKSIRVRPWTRPYKIDEEIKVKYNPVSKDVCIPKVTIPQKILELFAILFFYILHIYIDYILIDNFIEFIMQNRW